MMETTHITSRKTYFLVFLGLLVLLAATIGAAFIDLGFLNPIIALIIAFAKALLVVVFFMHVRYSSRLTKVFVISGLIWLGILILPTIADYISRILLGY